MDPLVPFLRTTAIALAEVWNRSLQLNDDYDEAQIAAGCRAINLTIGAVGSYYILQTAASVGLITNPISMPIAAICTVAMLALNVAPIALKSTYVNWRSNELDLFGTLDASYI